MPPTEISSTTYVAVIFLALLSGATTVAGAALAIKLGENPKAVAAGIGFSTGIMILISIFELIPESLGRSGFGMTSTAVLLGALVIVVLHIVIPHTHLVEKRGILSSRQLKGAYLVLFGLILHDIPEGFGMANAYLSSPNLGVLVALAIALHNVPEEFAIAVPAVAVAERNFLLKAALVSGLAEPTGAMLGLLAVHVDPGLNPLFMAFAAGAMVVVSVLELVPMAKRYGNMGLFGLGFLASGGVYAVLSLLLPQ